MSRSHLLLVLGPNSWGRAAMALRIAEDLRAAGERATFVAHDTTGPLFTGAPFPVELVAPHIGPLLQMVLDTVVESERPSSIILCDSATVHSALVLHGCDPDRLARYGVPLVPMDTWDYQESGFAIDRTETEVLRIPRWIESLPMRLLPVPMLRSTPRPGAFRCLPNRRVPDAQERRATREAMGLPERARLVLFFSASWQEARHHGPATQRVAAAVIELVARCIERLCDDVHLVHVGPSPFEAWARLDARYHAVRPLPDDQLGPLLAAADLTISANIAALTVTRAIAAGIPTVVIESSFHLDEDGSGKVEVPGFLREYLPLYPFSLWPLKYRDYLAPVLDQNDYCRAFERVELIEEDRLADTCRALLFDPATRGQHLERQASYLARLGELPTASQVMKGYLG